MSATASLTVSYSGGRSTPHATDWIGLIETNVSPSATTSPLWKAYLGELGITSASGSFTFHPTDIPAAQAGRYGAGTSYWFVVGLDDGTAACGHSPGYAVGPDAALVHLGPNAFLTARAPGGSEAVPYDQTGVGITGWTSPDAVISAYFRVSQTGTCTLSMLANSPAGSSVRASINGQPFDLDVSAGSLSAYTLGTVAISAAGYVRVDFRGLSRKGTTFGDIPYLVIGGSAASAGTAFVNMMDQRYWARRGATPTFWYALPSGNTEYFYNEVTVPSGNEVLGMYAEANGFSQGYFGMQVNSETERHILFSVWNDPDTSAQVTIPKAGSGVHTGTFSGEGTGGQAYWVYNWLPDKTYRFLLRVRPDGAGGTDFTAWFYAPELGTWKFIAQQHRTNTTTWYRDAYSFLECFSTDTGYLPVRVNYGNQWARTDAGAWSEVTQATIAVDGTGTNMQRMDWMGGSSGNQLFLKHNGFFAETGTNYQNFIRTANGTPPDIDLNTLPSN